MHSPTFPRAMILVMVFAGLSSASEPWQKPVAKRIARDVLADTDVAAHWIYDDLNAARAAAKDSGKPILALFRCVPCQCAATLDEEVRQQSESKALQRKFVCVRVVQMNGVNLEQFQFDRDLSFAVVFLNADGTVYGRYGTRATLDRKSMSHISHASFQKAMERALALHAGYPANRDQLAGKQGKPAATKYPEDMPHLKPFGGPAATRDCVHCHMVGEARLRKLREDDTLALREIWPYPLPESVGWKLDTDDGLLVRSVREPSPASSAGVQSGDRLLALNGQPLVSQGDVQWVLHDLSDKAELTVTVDRAGERKDLTVALEGDWRRADNVWRASLAGLRPNVEFRVDLFKKGKGIAPEDMALLVNYPTGTAAKAGLRNGDIVTAVDGRSDLLTDADVLRYVYFSAPRSQSLRLSVLRKGERLEITLPVDQRGP